MQQNHTYLPDEVDDYKSIHNGKPIKVISNPNHFNGIISKQQHIIYLPIFCEKSQNPLPTSFLKISYLAQNKFLEIFSLEAYINAFINHPIVRDVEYLTQEIAKELATVLGIELIVESKYDLNRLKQSICCDVTISTQLAQQLQQSKIG